jgi:hypothetical protein
MMTRRMLCGVMLAFPLLLTGCGDSNIVPISGTLTYKGKPVASAVVHFVPDQGRASLGETDAQGKFTLIYDPQNKGAVRGKHKVFVQYNSAEALSQPGVVPGMPIAPPKDLTELYDKYGATKSTIQVIVEKPESALSLNWE